MKHSVLTKIGAVLLCLVLVCGSMPLSAIAADTTTENTTEDIVPPDVDIPDDDGGDGTDKPDEGGTEEDGEQDIYANAVDVTSAEQLEELLSAQEPYIRIASDFVLDRTFYITKDTVIFTTEAHTLTRDPAFGGDIFVVGEHTDGTFCETAVTLSLGDPASEESNLLTIDGNQANLTADVTGSVLFVVKGSSADLYENITISNHKKVGNEKTLTDLYGVSYVGRVGGAVAIVTAGATMNIYGGLYTDNTVNDFGDTSTEEGQVSTYGGAVYNFGKLNIYGGVFQNNHAGRGGVIYCYRTTKIYNAEIKNNTASTYGGAIYMPNSTGAVLYLGGENSYADSQVYFRDNRAANGGGAIYARNKLEAQDAHFIGNTANDTYGGAVTANSSTLIFTECVFDNNVAGESGGAIYHTNTNGNDDVYEVTCIDCEFTNNRAVATSGGALYMGATSTAYLENTNFTENTAKNHGAAIYLSNASVLMDGGSFTKNSCPYSGGAIVLYSESSVKMTGVTAAQNSAKSGGFIYNEASEIQIFDSNITGNTSTSGGGAIYMASGAFGGVYATTFHGNKTDGNGGAVFAYTNGYTNENKVVLHSCTYTNNQGAFGGAIYASNKAVVDLFNSVAKENTASKGGFLYHTTTNTTVNLAALTLQGNTATEGGPIIWGNSKGAVLNLDKSLWLDKEQGSELDDTYWASSIFNTLKVVNSIIEIPNYISFDGEEITPELPRIPVGITSSEELENALADGRDLLRIDADFQLDRTFYIYRKTTIYALEAHTLTRAPEFAGDIFVVGEQSNGDLCENNVVLTLGDPEISTKDLLIIDGNKENLTTTVTGSVLFIVKGASADLYDSVTIRNHKKLGNEKTLTEKYGVSYVNQVGGAVAILASGSSMNIYGGTYADNLVGDAADGDSSQGGAIYNFGKLNIYGGTFEGNSAARGGAIYCYRTTNIYKAEIKNNHATTLGGAIYMPNSTSAILNTGAENTLVESYVVFSGNTADTRGGAIYANNKVTLENTTFSQNSSASGGAIVAYTPVFVMQNCTFTENTASKTGGAIYLSGHNSRNAAFDLTATDCTFTDNTATTNGGALYLTSETVAQMKNCTLDSNSGAAGGAVYVTNSSFTADGGTFTENRSTTGTGGALALYNNAVTTLNKVVATGNTAKTSGGFCYGETCTLTVYRSTVNGNSANSNGGGLALYGGATAHIYDTDFVKNTSGSNGGGVFLYTDTAECLFHSCDFTENSGSFGGAIYASSKAIAKMYNITATNNTASKGGFLYETTTGTTLTLVGATISGNAATDGGPIIWGNSTGAVLNLDKAKFTDSDYSGDKDATYWAATIYNKLKVVEISEKIPGWLDYQEEAYDHMANAVDVSTAEELEKAIESGATFIRVIADIEIDRTFYITGKTTIFSTLPRTLTRAADFGGDFFVVGETAEGKSALMLGGNATLVLGNPLSDRENLLVIDGNKDNMTVPVTGSAFFITYSGIVDLHTNITAQNLYKTDNLYAYKEVYGLSRPNRIGGSLAVVASGSLNIYGGNYHDNRVNDEDATTEEGRNSTLGGLIYNQNNVTIHGGNFTNNQAARGGIIYTYRILNVYGGTFENNIATVGGGVFYAPNASSGHTTIGSDNADDPQVVFRGNRADGGSGGVLYSSALCSLVIRGNTTFEGNMATGSGGAICSYGQLTVRNSTFADNIAVKHGGAAYIVKSSAKYLTRINELTDCTFTNNQATMGGALAVYASSKDYDFGSIATVNSCKFTNNIAASPTSKTTASYGGAIYTERKASLTMTDSTLKNNQARTEGGAIYAGGGSTLDITSSKFTQNTVASKGKYGGAIAIHSVTLDLTDTTFTENSAPTRAGALYISYSSALDRNSEVTIHGGSFNSNTTEGLGGAIYVTKQTVTEDKQILAVHGTDFTKNTATEGGAIVFAGGSAAYMTDTVFSGNQATEGRGGAIYNANGVIELDTAEFTKNTAVGAGGAIANEAGSILLYKVTATGNTTDASGAFLYGENSSLTMYDSTIRSNTAEKNGGGIALYGGASANIYATAFVKNISGANGGGVFMYTDTAESVLHSCTFAENNGVFGGALYVSNASVGNLYNLTATDNVSSKGGFLYETTTGTILTLVGAVVSGNSATDGGPVIWGNSVGAVLNLDSTKFTDADSHVVSDAVANKLTVNDISGDIPTYEPYQSRRETNPTPPSEKQPVPVQPLFDLAQNSSDDNIDSVYNKFQKLDNSSNFMSHNVTTFENINGSTVTVDSFVYPTKGTTDNCNVGMGLLIWQAMCYKQAHPEETVRVQAASYRFSVQAAVNINRNSRYFGYMRQLHGTADYDRYGFVRISYLLVAAAKMGIYVDVIGHQDAYPVTEGTMNLYDYFTSQLGDPCDPAYVQTGIVDDYMNFYKVEWDLSEKGGTDMMHTKMCTASHYLDMNGVAHRNAVFSSSSNLDGINSSGTNANWKMQTGTIVSGHEAIYQTSVNYLNLIAKYYPQEGVYEFQNLVNRLSTEQAQMILDGRESEIPANEQIIYLGRDTDDVFELYFTPMGGDTLAWDEIQNPYCKYLRKLYNSEDYIIFTWNAAEYTGAFALGRQIEEMIIASFHENRDVRNKIYANMENFDTTTFDDLEVGVDIGVKNLNQWELGKVHNKDLTFSYVENGQRYYVSLLNSMNMHSGSMYYQSNFALVIKETALTEDSVFFTMMDHTTKGIVEHEWSDDVLEYLPEDGQDGYTYHPCANCDNRQILDVLHRVSDWTVVQEATATQNGVAHRSCTACDLLIESRELVYPGEDTMLDLSSTTGETFGNVVRPHNVLDITSTPLTIEATLQLDPSIADRGGVVVGNYDNSANDQLNLEIYKYGRPRLFMAVDGKRTEHVFSTDVRSVNAVHLAVTVDGRTAKLYLNGQLRETAEINLDMPTLSEDMVIGGDRRKGNHCYFKGTIYNVALFSDVRTEAEIKPDAVAVFDDEKGLMASKRYFREPKATTVIQPEGMLFNADSQVRTGKLSETPLTMEAIIQIPTSLSGRAGTILGNYTGQTGTQMNLEAYEGGKIRLYIHNGETASTYLFNKDVRSNKPVHIAVTLDDVTATLYVNGEAVDTQTMAEPAPLCTNSMRIGGDQRLNNTRFFQGRIYSVSLFGCVRTPEQIRSDMVMVSNNVDHLLYAKRFSQDDKVTQVVGDRIFTETTPHEIGHLSGTPKTLEATIQFSNYAMRGGVIMGNYDGLPHGLMNLEIYTNGRIRLYYSADDGTRQDCIFDPSVFSPQATHIAVTIEETSATLYINGKAVQTKPITVLPGTATDSWKVGGDNRMGNTQYFKGSVCNVALFSDVRTAEEILADMDGVDTNAEKLLYAHSFGTSVNIAPQDVLPAGTAFNAATLLSAGDLESTPLTMEAVIQLDKSVNGRGGIVIGNYTGLLEEMLNLEIYHKGKPRLFYSAEDGTRGRLNFNTDIRADHPVHIAVTIDGLTANLYVDGVLKESKTMPIPLPTITEDFKVGGDNRHGNEFYFKGTLYSASMFRTVRTPEQIAQDVIHVESTDADLLYHAMFVSDVCEQNEHVADAIITDVSVSATACGMRHSTCAVCGQILQVWRTLCVTEFTNHRNYFDAQGMSPIVEQNAIALEPLNAAPKTFEATIQLSKLHNTRAGVIMGNYNGSSDDQINLEVYTNGNPRLYYKINGVAYTYVFATDVRSDRPVHLALTIDGRKATLYLDGVKKQTVNLSADLPACTDNFFIGKDNRNGAQQYFAGTIYSAAMYSTVQTAQQIKINRYQPCSTGANLLTNLFFPGKE